MAPIMFPNPTRIFALITIVWLVIFSSGCYGEFPAPQRPVYPPTPVIEKVEVPTVESSPVVELMSVTILPTAEPNPSLPPTLAATPSLSMGELLDGTAIRDMRVGIISDGDDGQMQEQPCVFSPDNFYTCAVHNRLTQSIRITFTLKQRGDLSTMDLKRLQTSMEVVVYPYWVISHYTPAPPLVDASIREVSGGVWGADFRISSPDRAYSFFLMAEGRSLAGANLYLIPPEPFLDAPLVEEDNED